MVICCVLFLFSTAVVLTLACRPLYYHDVRSLHIEEMSGYSEEEIRENYDALIDYNLSPFIKTLEFPTLAMSREGEIHFREVKSIFQRLLWMALITGLIAVIGTVGRIRKRDLSYLRYVGIASLVIPAGLGALIALNWERAFVMFHELVFDNDYWLFDAVTDPVITILPDAFFMHCTLMILGLIAVQAVGCILASMRGKDAGL